MSSANPGVIYDATNSWNGYNHQGKIALWYAISEITKSWDPNKDELYNTSKLTNKFLEIEYMEDFAIGEVDASGKPSYISVHQVKNRIDTSISCYESAILGLLSHFTACPGLQSAVLHTTSSVNLGGKALKSCIQGFLHAPKYLIDNENTILNNRNDRLFREQITKKTRGRASTLKSNLLHSLQNHYPLQKELNASNLDNAFDAYLSDIASEKAKLSALPATDLDKVSICAYPIKGTTVDHCEVDQAADLLKSAIKSFFEKISLDPVNYRATDDYIDKAYCWMLERLDEVIVERNLHYDLYKAGNKDRAIYFSIIYDWLISDQINSQDEKYYLFHIKESMIQKMGMYCSHCKHAPYKCTDCRLNECQNKLSQLSSDELRQFAYFTNPRANRKLVMNSYPDFLGDGVKEPFSKGLRDIAKPFVSNRTAICYKGADQKLYTLTTLHKEHSEDDDVEIATAIYKNPNVYELLMDITGLISKDIDITSIQDLVSAVGPRVANQHEHIAYPNPIQVISLDEFLKK